MKRRYYVRLSDAERKVLQDISGNIKASKRIKKRCGILILADENAGPVSRKEIAVRCRVSQITVSRLIKTYFIQGLDGALGIRLRKSSLSDLGSPVFPQWDSELFC